MNSGSVNAASLQRRPAEEILSLNLSSSFSGDEKGDFFMGSSKVVRSIGKPEDDLKTPIAIIHENALSRHCLTRCLAAPETNFTSIGYSNVEEWQQDGFEIPGPIVLLCATGRKSTETAVRQNLDLVVQSSPEARVIVVSDCEEPAEIVTALEGGAKGYISMCSELDVALAAIRLVEAGGTFVPASGLLSSRSRNSSAVAEMDMGSKRAASHFTPKQLEVIDRLRQGEPNKIIAYKLNMGECTVKVHVRNIMRKIKARNRTEIAFLTNQLF
jgi:DNA-binding NarL/FixJ family response regulator